MMMCNRIRAETLEIHLAWSLGQLAQINLAQRTSGANLHLDYLVTSGNCLAKPFLVGVAKINVFAAWNFFVLAKV